MKNNLDALATIAETTKDPESYKAYGHYKSVYNSKLISTKQTFYKNKILESDNKQKAMWQIIRSERCQVKKAA